MAIELENVLPSEIEKRSFFHFARRHVGNIFSALEKDRLHSGVKNEVLAVLAFRNVDFYYVRALFNRRFVPQYRIARYVCAVNAAVSD